MYSLSQLGPWFIWALLMIIMVYEKFNYTSSSWMTLSRIEDAQMSVFCVCADWPSDRPLLTLTCDTANDGSVNRSSSRRTAFGGGHRIKGGGGADSPDRHVACMFLNETLLYDVYACCKMGLQKLSKQNNWGCLSNEPEERVQSKNVWRSYEHLLQHI